MNVIKPVRTNANEKRKNKCRKLISSTEIISFGDFSFMCPLPVMLSQGRVLSFLLAADTLFLSNEPQKTQSASVCNDPKRITQGPGMACALKPRETNLDLLALKIQPSNTFRGNPGLLRG